MTAVLCRILFQEIVLLRHHLKICLGNKTVILIENERCNMQYNWHKLGRHLHWKNRLVSKAYELQNIDYREHKNIIFTTHATNRSRKLKTILQNILLLVHLCSKSKSCILLNVLSQH